MKIEAIKYVLWVQDMERAVRFYRDALGLAVQFESPNWTELGHGDSIIALHNGGSGIDTPTGLSFHVDDVFGACAAIRDSGGEIIEAPHVRPGESILLSRVTDTEGNEFMLTARNG